MSPLDRSTSARTKRRKWSFVERKLIIAWTASTTPTVTTSGTSKRKPKDWKNALSLSPHDDLPGPKPAGPVRFNHSIRMLENSTVC